MDTADVAPLARDELTEPEQQVVQAAGTGALVNLRTRTARRDDPATGASWDATRTVRAKLLVGLLTGEHKPAEGRVRAVKLRGARITGQLDLEGAELDCPLLLQDCHFEAPIDLEEARAPVIRLPGCHVPGLFADRLETRGNLELSEEFTATGEVCLVGAHIGGQLVLDGARLANPGGWALNADGLTVDQAMFCGEGFTATGEVSLRGAQVGGQLDLKGAHLTNPNGPALAADRLSVDQHLVCGGRFTATGEVVLAGAHVSGTLDLTGAQLVNPQGRALVADGLTVDQAMLCRKGFTTTGEVRLVRAHISGELVFSGASLSNPDGWALAADALTVDQAMICGEGFTATGGVRLVGAHIGGQLVLDGARLANPGGWALNADGLTVDQAMFCREGFTATGEVRLRSVHVGGQLNFDGANLSNPDPNGSALTGRGLRAAELILLPRQRPDGIVDLTNARVGSFDDDPATWPEHDMLRLRGFAYETLENDEVSVRDRIGWVRRHPGGYTPQPYEQLAAAYRRAGRDEAARRVAVAKQWHRRVTLGPLGKLWNWLLYVTVGYGYRTWLAALWLAGLLVVGTRVFARAYPAHMLPAKQPAPMFSPVVYTLDRLLPIVNLGQRDAWIPQGAALRWSWVLTGAGWVLTTAVVAGLTGILKRD
jgi:hypothetical protein